MKAYLITHSVSDIAMLSVLYAENKLIDAKTVRTRKTAHQITVTLKTYLKAIQQAGVVINPSAFKMLLKCPDIILDFFFMSWLRTKMVKDMILPDYRSNSKNEIVQLRNDLMMFLRENDITPKG